MSRVIDSSRQPEVHLEVSVIGLGHRRNALRSLGVNAVRLGSVPFSGRGTVGGMSAS
jgi:hypothetical protein